MTETCTPQASPIAAKRAFKQRVRHWASTLEVPVVWLAVRPMPNKWASCSSNGHLHFSVALLSLDPSLWDYVIVHELLHLSVPNHGKLWKSLMRAYLGDWEAAAERLQQHAGIPSEPAPPAPLVKGMASISPQSTHSPAQE
jgi:predicted metal-dependent hydrolase